MTLSKEEVINNIITYLEKKNINIKLYHDRLIWNYDVYYSKFVVTLYLDKKDYNDENFTIKYHSNFNINTKRRRTLTSKGYLIKVYKNLNWIKSELNIVADKLKCETETKNKYCTELERHYCKIHKSVSITTGKDWNNNVIIQINCTDSYDKSSYYSISYKDNRYNLIHKIEYDKKIINLK